MGAFARIVIRLAAVGGDLCCSVDADAQKHLAAGLLRLHVARALDLVG
jgi:hypothetical protein